MVTLVKLKEVEPEEFKEVECDNCGSTIRYSTYELKSKWKESWQGPSGYIKYVNCPNCNEHVYHRYIDRDSINNIFDKLFDKIKNHGKSS